MSDKLRKAIADRQVRRQPPEPAKPKKAESKPAEEKAEEPSGAEG